MDIPYRGNPGFRIHRERGNKNLNVWFKQGKKTDDF